MRKTVFFVGISHKNNKNWETLEAFSSETNSWKIIDKIEKCLEWVEIYKTNLVDFTPTDIKGKIRYPNILEMQNWLKNLEKEIEKFSPNKVIIFWRKIYDFVISKTILEKSIFIYAYHPSYIAVYKRKEEEKYINDIISKI